MNTKLLLIGLLIVLIGCGQTQVVVDQTPLTQSTPQQPTEQVKPVSPPTTEQTPPSTVITPIQYDKKVKELMDKSEKIKSYAFYYVDQKTQLKVDRYNVKGNKIMIKLYEINEWDNNMWIDTVYLDLATKTAVGYCERKEPYRCSDNDRQFPVEYSYFIKKFPLDWLAEIPPVAKVTSSETVDDRFTDIVEYTDTNGNSVKLSMDEAFGVPLRIVINGKQAYYYKDMAFNAVKDINLAHT